jgi:hypothetical protein
LVRPRFRAQGPRERPVRLPPQNFTRSPPPRPPFTSNRATDTMDSVLLTQFQRVEAALSTLVDSIASYNPSHQAALDLVAADDELSRGLDERTEDIHLRKWTSADSSSCQTPGQPQSHPGPARPRRSPRSATLVGHHHPRRTPPRALRNPRHYLLGRLATSPLRGAPPVRQEHLSTHRPTNLSRALTRRRYRKGQSER